MDITKDTVETKFKWPPNFKVLVEKTLKNGDDFWIVETEEYRFVGGGNPSIAQVTISHKVK